MPLVVLDPIVSVNTAKSPTRTSAKLLTLLAYGRVCAYLDRVADAETAEVRDTVDLTELAWANSAERAYRNALDARHELERAIPTNASGRRPDDWRMAVSRELFGRVLHRVGELRARQVAELDGGTVWASIVIHASERVWETWAVVPDYTGVGDRDGNISIHTALRTGSNLLITKNPVVCEPTTPRSYSFLDSTRQRLGAVDPGSVETVRDPPQLIAAHLDWVVQTLEEEEGFALEDVDATVLMRIAPAGTDAPKSWPPEPSKRKRVKARVRSRRSRRRS